MDSSKSIKVFISSTHLDNAARRNEVESAVRAAGMEPVRIEYGSANPLPPVAVCEAKVRECQVYLGIVAARYGTIPDGHDLSYTHLEFRAAEDAGLDCLWFFVDLDTQNGQPSTEEALRVAGNLVTEDGAFAPPDLMKRVGIGSRMKMVFTDVAEGLSLPQWTLDEEADQPDKPWRYPQE